jgi:tetratricopeptide (TPR) repeat protein
VLGEVYIHKNDFKNSIAAFDKCLELRSPATVDSPNYSTVYHLGACYFAMQDYPTALKFLAKAVALNPDNPVIYWTIGNVCLNIASYIKAIDHYSTAIARAPQWNFNYPIQGRPDDEESRHVFLYGCLVNKGSAHFKIKEEDNCLKCNEEAYSIYKDEPTAPINIASLYAKKGNKEKVHRFLEEGIPLIQPENNKNLMSTLLYYDDFVEYRDVVPLLLRNQNKISQDEYDQYMQYLKTLQDKKTSTVKSAETSYINIERFTMGNENSRTITTGRDYVESANTIDNRAGTSIGTIHGTVNFDSAQNMEDFVSELKKLQVEIEKAKKNNSLNEESAAQLEKPLNEAITQSSKQNPDKGKIVEKINEFTQVAKAISTFVDEVKPWVKLAISAGSTIMGLLA